MNGDGKADTRCAIGKALDAYQAFLEDHGDILPASDELESLGKIALARDELAVLKAPADPAKTWPITAQQLTDVARNRYDRWRAKQIKRFPKAAAPKEWSKLEHKARKRRIAEAAADLRVLFTPAPAGTGEQP